MNPPMAIVAGLRVETMGRNVFVFIGRQFTSEGFITPATAFPSNLVRRRVGLDFMEVASQMANQRSDGLLFFKGMHIYHQCIYLGLR